MDVTALGRGKWRARLVRWHDRTVFGVWTEIRGDIVCMVPDKQFRIGSMALHLTSGNSGRKVPTKLDSVRFALSKDGIWKNDVDDNAEIPADHCHIYYEQDLDRLFDPPTECVLGIQGGLAALAEMMLGDFDFPTEVRIGLIDGNWQDRTGFNNNSHFLFLPVDGFRKAWGNMQVLMNPASFLLQDIQND